MTKEIDKESRIVYAELNRASIHALYLLVSLLYQWSAGLDGGFVEDGIKFPAIEAKSEAQKRRLKEQLAKVRRHAWSCLEAQGFKPGANISNGLHKTINQKIFILNAMATKAFPGDDVYLDTIIVQTKIACQVIIDLKELEWRRTGNWVWLKQSLEKLVKMTFKPELEDKVWQIYTPNVKKLMMGLGVVDEYVPEWK